MRISVLCGMHCRLVQSLYSKLTSLSCAHPKISGTDNYPESHFTIQVVSILQYGGVDSQRMNCTWYKRYFPFHFHSPPPPSQRPYTTIISIIFRSNGNTIPLFFIFIFFLSLQITPRCVFICFNPLHLSLPLLFCIFFISSSFCLLFPSIFIIIITSLEHPDQI